MSMPGLSVSLSSAIIESVAFSLLSTTQEIYAFTVFERVFKEFGLPQAIRTDNGVPGLLLPAFIGDVHRSLSSAAVPTLQLSKVCPRCGEPVIRVPRRPIVPLFGVKVKVLQFTRAGRIRCALQVRTTVLDTSSEIAKL
jgi:hypothetical protein